MKSKWIIASVLIVALIGLCLASLFAVWQGVKMARGSGIRFNPIHWTADTVNAEATDEKSLKVSGPVSLTLETFQGNITIEAGEDNRVTVKTKTTAWGNSEADAQAALKEIKVTIDQRENDIKINIDQGIEVDMLHIGPHGGRVDFTITVPKETAVTLNSTQGDLSLTGTNGSAKLNTSFGNIKINNVTGEITCETSNGQIDAKNIGADKSIKLSSEFGAISVEDAKASDITISTSNGILDQLKGIRTTGLLKVTSDFGDITVNDSRAKTAEIRSKNGGIHLETLDVEDSINVKSDFGNLTLLNVNANDYDLNTKNGKIRLDGVKNNISARSSFGSIEVDNAQDATIDLFSNNGTIRFSGSLGSGPHSISSDFGNIDVTLPAKSALALELKTSFGKITSNFSITVSGTMESNHWTGTTNGGGESLNIQTKNGNISLQSSKE